MTLTIDIPSDQLERFRAAARQLGVPPEELARAAILELLTRPADDFERAAAYVLQKNRALYERLS